MASDGRGHRSEEVDDNFDLEMRNKRHKVERCVVDLLAARGDLHDAEASINELHTKVKRLEGELESYLR